MAVAALFTVCGSVSFAPLKFASPAYDAVSVFAPTVVGVSTATCFASFQPEDLTSVFLNC